MPRFKEKKISIALLYFFCVRACVKPSKRQVCVYSIASTCV